MKLNQKIKDVLDNIINQMENSLDDDKWQAPWTSLYGRYPKNIKSGKYYRGMNVFMLSLSAMAHDYAYPVWGTYKQWQEKGGQVKRGEKSTPIFFYTQASRTETDSNGNDSTISFPMLKVFYVFNVDQVENFELDFDMLGTDDFEPVEEAEKIIKNTGAEIKFGGDRAFYSHTDDFIRMPHKEQFESQHGYYGTMFHELGHWTGHKNRLERKFSGTFGDEQYAFEELIAELTSAFVCASIGFEIESRQDHAKYLKYWLKGLRKDPHCLLKAGSQAQKAADYILGNTESE